MKEAEEGIIDVWKVTVDGKSCYTDKEQFALYMNIKYFNPLDGPGAVITKLKMHREVYEHLPEFDGF